MGDVSQAAWAELRKHLAESDSALEALREAAQAALNYFEKYHCDDCIGEDTEEANIARALEAALRVEQ